MRFGLDVAQQRMSWDELAGRVQFAEELGFDGAWGFDHFQPMYGDGPGEAFEGITTLAALSGVTSRIRLGLLVTGVTYRHPSVLAAQAITVDHASHGRLDRLAEDVGRDPASIRRAGSIAPDGAETARKHAAKWRDAGYSSLVCGWPSAGGSQVEAFARQVLPEFA